MNGVSDRSQNGTFGCGTKEAALSVNTYTQTVRFYKEIEETRTHTHSNEKTEFRVL